jgi:uroporphyrinogen III methyltransferase/synthase
MKRGMVYLVGAGPGDPRLITLRGIECLKQADVVIYDRLINRSILAYAHHAELIDVGKQPHCHTFAQDEINDLLIEKARAGKTVVRLKGGDPFVFGRGAEEASELEKAGLAFEIIPGVSSAIAAPAYAGIPVTHRGLACSVSIATGHRADFVTDPSCDWRRLAGCTDTLVFLMGVHNLAHIVRELTTNGRPPDTPVALVERATRTTQKTVVGTLADIVERAHEIRPPAVIVIGEVVRLRETLRWFDLPERRPLLGLRVLNTRPMTQAGELTWRLLDLGAEPVELPTIQAVPVSDSTALDLALNRLGSRATQEGPANRPPNGPAYEWIVFSSANTASFFINRLFALGYDVRALAGIKLAAAGRATAETMLEYGLVPDLLPTHRSGWDLAGVSDLSGRRVLVPCSDLMLSDLPTQNGLLKALGEHGAEIEATATYSIRPAEPDPVALSILLKQEVDLVTFTSPPSLTYLAKMIEDRPISDALSALAVACIGPRTEQAARQLGVRVDIVPVQHTIEGLLEAIVAWHTDGGG